MRSAHPSRGAGSLAHSFDVAGSREGSVRSRWYRYTARQAARVWLHDGSGPECRSIRGAADVVAEGVEVVKKTDLIMPVYLNQRVVFDFVAMLEGGIASVTQVSRSTAESGAATAEVSSQFGLSKALSSLLRIDLSAKVAGQAGRERAETQSEQRIHTPASLFIALRAQLADKKFIVNDSAKAAFVPGDIVEFAGVLRRNPLIETIASFVELMDMIQLFEEQPKSKTGKPSEMQKIKRQMELFIKAVSGSETVDMIAGPLESAHQAVVTVEQQYLNDPTMSDLADGTFRVVGKVVRVVHEDDEPISLNRKSAVGKLPSATLAQLKEVLNGPDLQQFGLPELEWEIEGPAIQVLPIAIFA